MSAITATQLKAYRRKHRGCRLCRQARARLRYKGGAGAPRMSLSEARRHLANCSMGDSARRRRHVHRLQHEPGYAERWTARLLRRAQWYKEHAPWRVEMVLVDGEAVPRVRTA